MDKRKPDLTEIQTDFPLPDAKGGLGRAVFRRLLQKRSSRWGLFLLAFLFLIAIFAKQIAPHDPNKMLIWEEWVNRRTPPCVHILGCSESQPQHLMGTDSRTRDYFSRVVYGSRASLFIGVVSVGSAMLIGTILGGIAGYSGGWWNFIIMRVVDVMLAFPMLLLALVVIALLGPGVGNIVIAIIIVQIPHFVRITRSSVIVLRETEFVIASRALGAGYFHILFNRILPNTLTPLIVKGSLGVATAILDAAALSFLGFGSDQDALEWGAMIGYERAAMFNAPHLVLFPGLAILITVLAFNLVGDGLRDSLDPRLTYSGNRRSQEI